MSDELKKTLPRIRTFAADFEHDQKEGAITVPGSDTPPKTVTSNLDEKVTHIIAPSKTLPPENHVPAFHELKKRPANDTITISTKALAPKPVAPIQVAPADPVQTVVVRNTKPAPSAASATIITDNKRAKQQFFPTLLASIQTWFKAVRISSKQKSAPKYTVSDTERRKGVIQKATTKSGAIFTADNETLKDEIRRREWEQSTPESHEPEISWSPNTEAGYPLLTTGKELPTAVVVSFKQRSFEPEPKPLPPTYVPPPMFVEPSVPETPPEVVELPVPETQPVVAQPPAPVITTPPTVVVKAIPKIVGTPSVTAAETETIPSPLVREVTEEQYALTTPEAHYRIKSIGDVTKLNTNFLSVGVVGVIAGIVILVVVGQALVGILFERTPHTTVALATPIGQSISVTDISLSTPSQEAIIIALQQIPSNTNTPQEFRITDASGAPLQKEVLLPLLGFTSAGSLSQSIDEVHITNIGSTRGIIFTVSDSTTAFGSLLAWESSMVDAFGTILTINPSSESIAVSDRTLQNRDVRVFTADNQEMLVYGFIDTNTVLITKDVPAFTAALVSQ